MKKLKLIATLALIPALVALTAGAAEARRRPSRDAIVTETAQSAASEPSTAAPAAAPVVAPVPAAPVAAQTPETPAASPQTQPQPAAQAAETPLYPASSSALMVKSTKPVVETPIRQGKLEAGGSLAYAWTDGLSDTMTLRGRVGVFYTRELSLGASFTTNLDGRDNVNAFFIAPQYHFFVDPKLVPFVEGKIGFGFLGDSDDDHFKSFALGVGGGVKYFHEDDAFFYLQFDDVRYFSDGGIASISLGLGLAKLF
jgi:hypothetical protein